MNKQGIYSADYIRPMMPHGKRQKSKWREIPFSALNNKEDLGWDGLE